MAGNKNYIISGTGTNNIATSSGTVSGVSFGTAQSNGYFIMPDGKNISITDIVNNVQKMSDAFDYLSKRYELERLSDGDDTNFEATPEDLKKEIILLKKQNSELTQRLLSMQTKIDDISIKVNKPEDRKMLSKSRR